MTNDIENGFFDTQDKELAIAKVNIKCQLLCPVRDNYLVRFFAPYIN